MPWMRMYNQREVPTEAESEAKQDQSASQLSCLKLSITFSDLMGPPPPRVLRVWVRRLDNPQQVSE